MCVSGCAPTLMGVHENDYLAGNGKYWGVNADALNRNIAGRMAITKLADQPVSVGTDKNTVLGYRVSIKNLSRNKIFNVRLINGPDEGKSFPMFPGKKTYAYLTPGNYTALQEYRGKIVDIKPLTVGVQTNLDIDNELVHNYILLED